MQWPPNRRSRAAEPAGTAEYGEPAGTAEYGVDELHGVIFANIGMETKTMEGRNRSKWADKICKSLVVELASPWWCCRALSLRDVAEQSR